MTTLVVRNTLDANRDAPDIVYRLGTLNLSAPQQVSRPAPSLVDVRVRPEHEIIELKQGLALPLTTKPLAARPERPRRGGGPARWLQHRIARARSYQHLLDTGEAASRTDLGRREGISHERVSEIMDVLRLAPEILEHIDRLAPDAAAGAITQKQLRQLARIADHDDQLAMFRRIVGAHPRRQPALDASTGAPLTCRASPKG